MTELLAALLGALVGGAVSAWASAKQTAKVLKHETDLAAEERREAQRQEDERRVTSAADHLLAALADFATVNRDEPDTAAWFVRIAATADVHAERSRRVNALVRAGAEHAHMLPGAVRQRWDALVWLVRYCHRRQDSRSQSQRRRDGNDLIMYAEYVRRTLVSLSGAGDCPPDYPPPDTRREGERPWGHSRESGTEEPDYTDWFMGSRIVGGVKFKTGERRWYGPLGEVEVIERASEPDESATS